MQLFDCLLQSDLTLVLQELTNCQSLVKRASVQEHMLHSVKLRLEEDTVAYLSLVPDSLCSSVSVSGETGMTNYLHDGHSQVSKKLPSTLLIYKECLCVGGQKFCDVWNIS